MKLMGRFLHFSKLSASYRRNTRTLVLLLLVPVIIIFLLNFFILYKRNVVSMEEKLHIESEQKLELLNANLAPMYQLVDLRRTDRVFSTDYLRGPHFSDAYFEITQALKRDSVWISFFDNISYYNCEYNKVFTYNCAKSPEEFFGWNEIKHSYPVPSLEVEDAAQQLLEQEGNQVRILRAHNIRGEDGIVFAVPIEMHDKTCPASYMIFTVSDTTLANLWGIKDGISYTLFYNQIAVYSSGTSVEQRKEIKLSKLLSEILLRVYHWKLGGTAILWQIYPVYFLQNILPAIFIEAIITFAVLTISLILLLHYSRKNYEPVREILKRLPQQTEKTTLVDEFRYIDFMLENLTNSKNILEQTNREMQLEKYLYYILGNLVEPGSELARQCLEAGVRIDRRWYTCILLIDTSQNDYLHQMIYETFIQIDNTSNLYCMNVNETKQLYLFASDLEKEILEEGFERLRKKSGSVFYISCLAEGIQNIHNAYSSICGSVSQCEGKSQRKDEYPVLELQFLQAAIEEANVNKAEFSIRMLKKYIDSCSDMIRGAILVAAGAIFNEKNISQINALIYGMTEFDAAGVCERLDFWLDEYRKKMNVTVKSRSKVLVRNMHTILEYIEMNATLPDFTIKAMAAEFGTSVSNLGHQFKNATGQTLSRFIDDWKIKKAEEMLASGESINEISRKLGYLTTPAFTEAFKRLRGMTPSSYRNNCIGASDN